MRRHLPTQRLPATDRLFISVGTLTGIYTAQGDSKTPFYANLIGLATNMVLDPILILGPGRFRNWARQEERSQR